MKMNNYFFLFILQKKKCTKNEDMPKFDLMIQEKKFPILGPSAAYSFKGVSSNNSRIC